MLGENLKALRIAFALMNREANDTDRLTREDLQDALGAIAGMIRRTENAQRKFSAGTSPHTLQKNRLAALRVAAALLKKSGKRKLNR